MRRALLLAPLALAAIAPAATAVAAAPTLELSKTNATFLAVDHSLWVHVEWTPPAKATDLTVVVKNGSQTLKTLQARHWLVGAKTFDLTLPRSVPDGSTLRVTVHASSVAGSADSAVSVPLR
jgi:hypothetical protein